MKKLFERLASPSRAEPRLRLAAFGKHPGWDDHIPGIGLETETLARLKQVLYVEGIGAQIDSGAWEKLEVDKRYDNFDHSFLWLWPDRLVTGLLWSSTDRKGRSKYPMVLCVEAQAVSPAFLVKAVQPGLSRLRDACKGTSSPEEVERLCRAAQNQLTALLSGPALSEHPGFASLEQRRAFLDHPDNGPDHLGLLRLLHELSLVPSLVGGRGVNADLPESRASEHLRLPLAAASAQDSMLLWGGLLVCAVADTVPVLVMSRAGESYLEAIVGEPDPGDFFCLQTTPAAQPLVTTIPYQLSPSAPQNLDVVVGRFLESRPAGDTAFSQKAAAASAGAGAAAPGPGRSSGKLLWAGLALVLAGMAMVAFWLTRQNPKVKDVPPAPGTGPTTNAAVSQSAAAVARPSPPAAGEAVQALQAGDYSNALFKANQALALSPDDPLALDVKRKAGEALLIASEVGKSGSLSQSMTRARAADKAENWETAVAEYERAGQLAVETRDNAASTEAKSSLAFVASMLAGRKALQSHDYRLAAAQADKALQARPGHPSALQLRSAAQTGQAEQEAAARLLQDWQAATNAAIAALSRRDFSNALTQADKAVALKPNDPAGIELQRRAKDGIAAEALAERKKRLAQDLQSARNFLAAGDYAQTLALCATHSEQGDFATLAAAARNEQALLETARNNLSAGDYAPIQALKLNACSSKPAFAGIIAQAAKEEEHLARLRSARQTNGWQAVLDYFASPEAERLATKKPFAELHSWAGQQAKAAAAATPQPVEKLDEQLQVLLVRYKVVRPDSPTLTVPRAREEKPFSGPLPPTQQKQVLEVVARLEQEFARGSWLEQNDRKRLLQELRERVRYWQ